MNNENNTTTIEDNAKINALNNSGDNMDTSKDTTNNINNSDIKPIKDGNRVYNIQNLKPVQSTEEARKRGRNGGIKSGEVRRAKKTMKETVQHMISQEVAPDKLKAMGVDIEALGGDYTYQAAIIAAMLREAVNGDTKAMALLRDTMGEQPTLHTINQTEIITKEDLQTIDNLKQYLTG